ncbi:MAG TPA: hypothetical protein PLF21_04810 [Exilispira sp.]|nr:hypothetical protein [Exilispira sp.]
MKKAIAFSVVLILILSIFTAETFANTSISGLLISPFPGINYPYELENITCAIGFFGLVIPSFHGFASSLLYNSVLDWSNGFASAFIFQTYLNGFDGVLITGGFNNVYNYFKGFEFSIFVNVNFGKFIGLQAAILNYNSQDFTGFQVGFLNLNMKEFYGYRLGFVSFSKRFNGYLDISLIASFNFSSFIGVQASLVNFNLGHFSGLQLGLVNFNLKDTYGVRVGLVSFSNNFSGFQINLINISNLFDGFQIGLINIAKVEKGVSIGLFNFFLNGYNVIETSYNELDILKINFKWGSKKFYSIIGYGMNESQTIYQSTFGFGSHFKGGIFFLDIEFFIQGRSSIENLKKYLSKPEILYRSYEYYYDEYYGYYYYPEPEVIIPYTIGYLILGDSSSFSLRLNLGVSLGFVHIIAGVTYNLGFRLNPDNAVFSWYIPENINPIMSDINNFAFFQYGWFGFTLGVQFQL